MVIAAASAIALGTYAGGWRIIRTVGTRIINMDSAQGFAAEGAGAAVILASSHFGYPLSSTHVISGRGHRGRRREAAVGGQVGHRGQSRSSLGDRTDRRRMLALRRDRAADATRSIPA